MDKVLALLTTPLKGVPADVKFVLLRLVLAYPGQSFAITFEEMAKALCVTETLWGKAANRLTGAGYLIRERTAPQKGRPSWRYRLAPERIPEPATGHLQAVEQYMPLLSHILTGSQVTRRSSTLPKGKRLSPSNRLVLMALIASAGPGGVVRGKGVAELASLCGLSSNQLSLQIDKLTDLGYVRAVVPGVSGRNLFGKAPSAYFLNLRHASFGTDAMPGTAYLILARDIDPENHERRSRGAHRLCKTAERRQFDDPTVEWAFETYVCSLVHGPSSVEVESLAMLFDKAGTQGLSDYLQVKIEEFVSAILTNCAQSILPYWPRRFDVPAGDDSPPVWAAYLASDGWLRARIRNEVLAPSISQKNGLSTRQQKFRELIVEVIYQITVRLAVRIKSALEQTYDYKQVRPPIDFEKCNIIIIPWIKTSHGERYIVDVTPKVSSALAGNGKSYLMHLTATNSGYLIDRYRSQLEGEYSDEEKYRLGLLTRAKRSENNRT